MFDITIVGGGCVGLATAYKISRTYPGLKLLVLEKEQTLSAHQTGRNSGVIHSGIYYKPGSYKAKNCVDGRRELVSFAREHRIPHDICGKIIVATHESELDHMQKVFNNGKANDVEGIEMINAGQIKEIEPYCEGISGIYVPCTGIIDYIALTNKLAELVTHASEDNKVICGAEVTSFQKENGHHVVVTPKGIFKSAYLITCAGLQSDRVARNEGAVADEAIVGFRGDYYDLSASGMNKVKHLIYPVPNPQFPFLGVHFTRMIHGGVECGPNAVFVFKREGYGKTDFSLADTVEALGFSGTWKFFARHWKFGLDEYRGAFSKSFFLKRLQKLIPSLTSEDIVPGRAGVRAMALNPEGYMIDDFKIVTHGNAIHVLNAPSPAATACLAIGQAIAEMAAQSFRLVK